MALHRDSFPVTAIHCFLNSAAESPLNTSCHTRVNEYLATTLHAPHTKPSTVRQDVRKLLASLLGGTAEDFALVSSTAMGINTVAAGLSWSAGDNVVIPAGEHWSNRYPWDALRERGVEIRVVPLCCDNSIDADAIDALVDARTRVVTTAHVQFATGHRTNLRRLSAIAHKKGALLVVDGIQGAGAVPLSLVEDGIDVYTAGGFKWLLGMPGTGFLYVSKAARALIKASTPGMFSTPDLSATELTYYDDARRYESGSIAYSLFHGWTASLALLSDIGISTIYRRNQHLAVLLVHGLSTKPHIRIVSPLKTEEERSQIVVFTCGTTARNAEVCARLLENGVIVSNRGDTIRASVNFFNTDDEVQKLIDLL